MIDNVDYICMLICLPFIISLPILTYISRKKD